jgi:uncharacterized protein
MYLLLISVAILSLVYGYSGWRLISPAPLAASIAALAWILVGLGATLPHFNFWLRDRLAHENKWTDALAWLTYTSLGLAVLIFSLLVTRDLLWILWDILVALGAGGGLWDGQSLSAQQQQAWLNGLNLTILATALVLALVGFITARGRPSLVSVEVPVDGLPEDLEGYRIAHISDLHIGPTLKRPFVATFVEQVNALEADLIAFTGDMADGDAQRLQDDVSPLQNLSAPDGVYFVTGNHEYYSGVEQWLDKARQLGFSVLLNDHVLKPRGNAVLLVAGVTDFGADAYDPSHKSDPALALRDAGPHDFRLLLAHQPRSIAAAAKAGFDLQLSGHTHGGQFIPWKYLVPLQQPYIAGLYRQAQTWLYVSRGVGYWGPPLRLGAPSDISLITLKKA